jgi:hypothetical protein
MPTVEFISLIDRYVILEDGRKLPIVRFFNQDDEDVPPEEAYAFTCGSDSLGWFVIFMDDIEPIDRQ